MIDLPRDANIVWGAKSHGRLAACPVQALIEEEGFVQPEARRNEMLGWVRAGLRDFSISRAAVAWGIPIPQDPSQTVYVWFDALLGYMSGALRSSTMHLNAGG